MVDTSAGEKTPFERTEITLFISISSSFAHSSISSLKGFASPRINGVPVDEKNNGSSSKLTFFIPSIAAPKDVVL